MCNRIDQGVGGALLVWGVRLTDEEVINWRKVAFIPIHCVQFRSDMPRFQQATLVILLLSITVNSVFYHFGIESCAHCF